MKNLWQVAIICILFTVALAYPPPYDTWTIYKSIQLNSCKSGKDVEDLCQRCAKLSLAQTVYPMCCTNMDEVRTWCQKAIDYGKRQ